MAGVSLWSGPAPMVAPWDNFILLDGGYRIILGQVPGTDFTNPIGPLAYELVSLGMRVQAVPSLVALTYGDLMFLGVTAFLAWIVAWPRMRLVSALGFTIFIGLVVVAVRPLGYAADTTSYAMLYNRYGWVLYTILLVLVLLRPREDAGSRGDLVHGSILGVLIGLSFYCKITYFLVGVGAVVVGLVLDTLPRRRGIGIGAVAGFLAVGMMFWLVFGIRVTGYLGDLATSVGAQGGQQRLSMLANSVFYTLPVTAFTILVLCVLAKTRTRNPDARPKLSLLSVSVAAAYVLGSSVLVSAGNAGEKTDLPALVVIVLLLVGYQATTAPDQPAARRSKPLLLGLIALVVVAVVPIASRDALSIANSVSYHLSHPPRDGQLASEHLRDFTVPANSTWETAYRTANQVPGMLNDGMALLRRHIQPTDTVAVVAMTNPFSFALSLPPARGVPLWWDVDISFDANTHLDAAQVFGSARWVMIPRMVAGQGCCQATVQAMLDLYDPYLSTHYVESERTDSWLLLVRA
ncbi:hypothetical protein [Actinophytocola sp.]|uniref:hypothetical protein n=1 Tax=Actinophytocola sp. TaxID=1872138 RepID=UPI002ECFDDEF